MRRNQPPSQPELYIRVARKAPGLADVGRHRPHRGLWTTRQPNSRRIVIRSSRQASRPGAGERSRVPPTVRAGPARRSCAFHHLQALAATGGTDPGPSTRGAGRGRVENAFRFVNRAAIVQVIGQADQDGAKHFALAPRLKATMRRLAVALALRQHEPLWPGVESPRARLRAPVAQAPADGQAVSGDVLLPMAVPNPLPRFVAQSRHRYDCGRPFRDSMTSSRFRPDVPARGDVGLGGRAHEQPVASGKETHAGGVGCGGRDHGARAGRQPDPDRGRAGTKRARGVARVERQPGIAAGSPAADPRRGAGAGVRQPQGPESPDGTLACQVGASRHGHAAVPVARTRRIDAMARMSSTVVAVPVGSTTTRSATRVVLARTRPACG